MNFGGKTFFNVLRVRELCSIGFLDFARNDKRALEMTEEEWSGRKCWCGNLWPPVAS